MMAERNRIEDCNIAECLCRKVEDCSFGKITHGVTYIVALLEKKRRICPKLILKRVKALGTEVRPYSYISPQ